MVSLSNHDDPFRNLSMNNNATLLLVSNMGPQPDYRLTTMIIPQMQKNKTQANTAPRLTFTISNKRSIISSIINNDIYPNWECDYIMVFG